MRDLHQELKEMASFYMERPCVDETQRSPSMTEISNRERKAIALVLLRAASATAPKKNETTIKQTQQK